MKDLVNTLDCDEQVKYALMKNANSKVVIPTDKVPEVALVLILIICPNL